MWDNFNNPDGSFRRMFHPPQRPPYPNQHPRFFHHHPQQFRPRFFNERMEFYPSWTPPLYARQNFQQQPYVERRFSRGSTLPVPGRVPVQMKTTSALERTLEATPPAPVLTPQPTPFPPSPVKHVGAMVVAQASKEEENEEKVEETEEKVEETEEKVEETEEKLEETEEKLEETEEKLEETEEKFGETEEKLEDTEETFGAEAFHKFTVLGQVLGIMQLDYENKSELLTRSNRVEVELRAANEALTVQLKEAEDKFGLKNDKSEDLILIKSELKRKDEEIKSLEKKVGENETQISQRVDKVRDLESEFRKLKKELEEKHSKIKMVEGNYKNKCEEFSKLKVDFNKINTKNTEMQRVIDDFVKMHEATIKKLETERNFLKLSVKELEMSNLERINENFKISRELEKERNENKDKKLSLEKKNKIINELKENIKSLDNENDVFRKKFNQQMNQFFETFPQKRRKLAVSSSVYSEKETCPEPSSVEVEVNENYNGNSTSNEAEQLVNQDIIKTPSIGKWKIPKRKSSGPVGHDETQNSPTMPTTSQILNYQRKSNTGNDTAISEVSSSSRSINSPSRSGRPQRNRKET